jgi:hypothetical protein
MFNYIYVIHNNIFPENVYKIDVTSQNYNQLLKQYNKYYPDNITVIVHHLVPNSDDIYNKLIKKYNINNNFIKVDINIFIVDLENMVKNVNFELDLNLNLNLNVYIEKMVDHNILLNDLFTVLNNKISFLEFVYYLNNKYKILYENGKYYLKDHILKHKKMNIYEQFIQNNIFINNNKHLTHRTTINYFKRWFKKTYPYLKIPHKSEFKKNLIDKITNIFNINPSIKNDQVIWNNLSIYTLN